MNLVDFLLLLGLFLVTIRVMMYPAEFTLRLLTLGGVLLLAAMVAVSNWQADAALAPGRAQGVLVLLAAMLPELLGLRLPEAWGQFLRGEGVGGGAARRDLMARRSPASLRPGPERRTWAPGEDEGLPAPDEPPPPFEDYQILRRIGVGGMGSVYLARRRSDGQEAALKVPQLKYVSDTKFVNRFFREAEILGQFHHPNVVEVFDYRMEAPEYYIAMEYLDGISLEDVLAEEPLSMPRAVQLLRALADGLRHIHLHKVIHRDLKPSNVMVLWDAWDGETLRPGGVKLMDFGIAAAQSLTRLTMTGARVGTPSYMAPEQAKGQHTDARSDLYSLGLLGYEMVAGRPAFEGTYETVVHQQIFEEPRPPNQVRRGVPSRLNDLILSMIEKDPAHRPNLDEVIAALDDNILVDEVFDEADVLVLAAEDPYGPLRLLDTSGKQRQSCGTCAPDAAPDELQLPGLPSALGAGAPGELLVAFGSGRRAAGELVWVLDSAGNKLRQFGEYGLGEGQLLRPAGAAYLDGLFYVLDAEAHRVKVYGPAGDYRFGFGHVGSGAGEFLQPQALCAAGQSICVLDYGNHRVQRFDPRGAPLSPIAFRMEKGSDERRPLTALSADSSGAVYVVDSIGSRIRCIDAEGAPSAPVTFTREVGESADAIWLLAVGPRGQIYAVPRGSQLLRIFSPAGDLIGTRNTYTPVLALTAFHRVLP